jgi:hypothetical protein
VVSARRLGSCIPPGLQMDTDFRMENIHERRIGWYSSRVVVKIRRCIYKQGDVL